MCIDWNGRQLQSELLEEVECEEVRRLFHERALVVLGERHRRVGDRLRVPRSDQQRIWINWAGLGAYQPAMHCIIRWYYAVDCQLV